MAYYDKVRMPGLAGMGEEIGVEDFQSWLNSTTGGKAIGDHGLGGYGGLAWLNESGALQYETGWKNSPQIQNILGYLKARNQGKQAQEEYIKLLKERPGRQGTILTAGSDPTTAQTIKTVLGTPNPQKTVLGA